MKAILDIDDATIERLEREANRQGRTVSQLVEEALQAVLGPPPRPDQETPIETDLPPLPTFDMGGANVDISNRSALYDFMDRHDA